MWHWRCDVNRGRLYDIHRPQGDAGGSRHLLDDRAALLRLPLSEGALPVTTIAPRSPTSHLGGRRIARGARDLAPLLGLGVVAFLIRAVPVLVGGGLQGLLHYDDGVYFGAAVALVHGSLPYRDFLLLHPPGNVVALAPFAAAGALIGDANGFAAARLAFMVIGATNAVLAALVAGRFGRWAGFTAGALYAVWYTSANFERSTDLHTIQSTLLLIALLVLAQPGRVDSRRAAVAGVALGLATSVQLWQGVSVLVLLGWVAIRARGRGGDRLRPVVAFLGSCAVAFLVVCLPFFLAAPDAMVRFAILDQLNRPNTGVSLVDRLRALEGLPLSNAVPVIVQRLTPSWLVIVAAIVGAAATVVTAWRLVWTRPWAALMVAQMLVVLLTPSFFNDYPSLAAPAATLVLGTGIAWVVGRAVGAGVRPALAWLPVAGLIGALALVSAGHPMGSRLQLAALTREIAGARCVSADVPSLLILTGGLRRDRNNRASVRRLRRTRRRSERRAAGAATCVESGERGKAPSPA